MTVELTAHGVLERRLSIRGLAPDGVVSAGPFSSAARTANALAAVHTHRAACRAFGTLAATALAASTLAAAVCVLTAVALAPMLCSPLPTVGAGQHNGAVPARWCGTGMMVHLNNGAAAQDQHGVLAQGLSTGTRHTTVSAHKGSCSWQRGSLALCTGSRLSTES